VVCVCVGSASVQIYTLQRTNMYAEYTFYFDEVYIWLPLRIPF